MDNNGTLNLDQNLFPVDSPYATDPDPMPAYQFNSEFENNAISAAKIQNLSFNQASGGTINLGGPGNGNGELLIKDSSGNVIVQGDSTGLHVYNGSVSIQNTSGSSVIDSMGLNSLVSFLAGGTAFNPNTYTTSTSYVPVANSTVPAFILDRPTRVLLLFTVEGYNISYPGNADFLSVQLLNSFGTSSSANITLGPAGIWATTASWSTFGTGGTVFNLSINNNVSPENRSGAGILTFSAGTHTLSAQYKSNAGGSAYLGFLDINYLILGN